MSVRSGIDAGNLVLDHQYQLALDVRCTTDKSNGSILKELV